MFFEKPYGSGSDSLEPPRARRVSDNEAIEMIEPRRFYRVIQQAAKASSEERDRAAALLKCNGLTVRLVSRLTGINRGIVQRARTSDRG